MVPKDSSNSYEINVHDGLVHKIEKGPWKGRFGERISGTQRLRKAVKCATDLPVAKRRDKWKAREREKSRIKVR